MATRESASTSNRGQQKSRKLKIQSEEYAYGVPIPNALHEAIESERDTLAKAESLLGCLVISLQMATERAAGPYYPDVVQMAQDLVRQSINGLDSLRLQQAIARGQKSPYKTYVTESP